ncbi:hypothetical protein [Leifsonia shinshuensis]|uniref:Ig-like domain-containing protein n=1 Tax=Leifsonia shinshuensis TaxID=150026 RepID=A0A853CTA5_9MICO|nr:hypothetical protein [Leifsonia shinshuensis]NYJ23572.1 hypothetical protein [Leifsonia shinshuensis]
MSNRGILTTATAVAATLFLSGALSGCSPGPAPADATAIASASPTPSATESPTPQPLDARSAWNACAAVAQSNYVAQNPGAAIIPFSPATTLQTDGSGATFVVVDVRPAQPIAGAASIAVICTVSGTAVSAQVDSWLIKDI